ncbi:MAG: hypothetical protein ACRDE2_10020, partial [Chitinophagaceae bacterium]
MKRSIKMTFWGKASKKIIHSIQFKLRLFLISLLFFYPGIAVFGQFNDPSTNLNYGDSDRFPLLMPDDFDSLFLVAWRQELGVPDPRNPLLTPAMPWDSGGIMAHGTVLHDPIDGLWKAWQVSTPPEKNLKGLKAMHEHWRSLT